MRTGVYQVGGLCAGFYSVGEAVSGDVLFEDVGDKTSLDRLTAQNIKRCRFRRMNFLDVPVMLSYADATALNTHPCVARAFRDIHVSKSLT